MMDKRTRGIRTISGSIWTELMMAWGYDDARDRMFQMDLTRRFAAGRVAELVGAPALELDCAQRTLRLTATARATFRTMDTEQRAWLTAYASGVNRRLRRHPAALEHRLLRVRMDRWRPEDTLLVLLSLAQQLALDVAGERTRAVAHALLPREVAAFLLPRDDEFGETATSDPEPPVAELERLVASVRHLPPEEVVDLNPTGASNCWVVGGGRTAHGHPILANDMHLATGAPNVFRRVDLALGSRRVHGFAVPGAPVVAAGSNGDVAWGLANIPADYTRLVPVNDEPQRVEAETIKVRGGQAITHDVVSTPAGPVLSESLLSRPVALRWAGHRPGYVDIGWTRLIEASSVGEAVHVLSGSGGLPLAVVCADRHGATVRTVGGRFPRTAEEDLLPGDLPTGARPLRRGTADEVMVAANDPWRREDEQSHDVGRNYPTAYRRSRLEALLTSRGDWSEQEVAVVQEDHAAGLLEFYLPFAREALGAVDVARQATLAAALDAWDGSQGPDSRGAALLWTFRVRVQQQLMASLLRGCRILEPGFRFAWRNPEPVVRALLRARPRVLDGLVRPGEGWTEFLAFQLEHAAHDVESATGRSVDEVRWCDVVSVQVRHPLGGTKWTRWLDLPELVPGGGPESVAAYTVASGPVQRLVVAPGLEDHGLAAMLGGQSGNPFSPFYRDQHRDWRRGRLTPLVLPTSRRNR